MKKILLFVLGAALCACTSKNPDDIVVNVEVENMTVSNVGLLIDRSTSFTIPLDKHGKGRLVITGLGNIYPRVIYGQTAKMAFIGRGEEVTLRFDGRKFKDGFRVEGRNVEANEYLQTMTLPEFNAYDLPWEEFFAEINRLADDAVHLMKARKLEQTCPDFAKVEEARLRYLYAQTMVMYPMGHQLMGGDPDYRPGREVYDAVGKMVVEREDLADVDVYRDFIHFAIPLVLEGQGREFGDAGKKNNIFGVDVAKAIAGVTTSLDDDHALACFLGYDGKASLNLPTATMFDAMSEDDPAKAVTCTQDGEGYVTAAKWGGVGMDMMGIGVKVTSETIFEFTYAE